MKDSTKAQLMYDALCSVRPVSRPFSTLTPNETKDLLRMFNALGKSLSDSGYRITQSTK